ncbi:hypothetical protein [Oceanibacterium hippocampi]|uniref:Lipoprotein n=1 Tax=Oceanibacterium hippocampi TaxID=745714 RepID=A0A1Y5TVG7_9PROT|nr:hypothetical protein [Oceanibacterium hippocampi]SLN73000.1 hypothetical protein OCH7691_03539 [Oceanibacterium hippocampi]
MRKLLTISLTGLALAGMSLLAAPAMAGCAGKSHVTASTAETPVVVLPDLKTASADRTGSGTKTPN